MDLAPGHSGVTRFFGVFVAVVLNCGLVGQPAFARAVMPGLQRADRGEADPGQPAWLTVDPADLLVPQTLLPLLHTPEVQQEMQLDSEQVKKLEQLFAETDGPWWRSRNQPLEERRATIAGLETTILAALPRFATTEAIQRLRQLECQAQSSRVLLRKDVAAWLEMGEPQVAALRTAATATDELAAQMVPDLSATAREELTKALQAAQAKENQVAADSLDAGQRIRFSRLAGEKFDTAGLSRIYPLAPELIETHGWVGQSPGTLASLRGKVVLIHFYAFECINCQRNLPRYNEWHREFAGQDVVLIGIQTPELESESDPGRIAEAAESAGTEYPVLMDLEGRNWNAWANTMWPTVYVIDRKGYIRSWWQGELNWQGAKGDREIAEQVKRLLAEE
jgi:peroxiredoxin